MMVKTLTILAVLSLSIGATGSSVQLKHFEIEQDGRVFEVRWESTAEVDARTYELFRKTGYAADFVLVQSSAAHGAGKEYVVRDDHVYKTALDQIDYRLDVIFNDGIRQRLAEKKVNYTPTAIRRSWGSIKAMFQN